MSKIVIYVGSPNGSTSNTLNYINRIISQVKKKTNKKIEVEVYTPKNSSIMPCSGCLHCFYTGKCSLDALDDMKKIKNSLSSADLIILGSPIYVGNVSGSMKNFFDRISSWTHLFYLRNKAAVNVTSSSGNGLSLTANYMKLIVACLGMGLIGDCSAIVLGNNKSGEPVFDDNSISKINLISSNIVNYLNGSFQPEVSSISESLFHNLKNTIKENQTEQFFEYRYWSENKLFEYKSFKDVLA